MDSAIKYQIVEKIVQSKDETLLNEIKSLVGLSDNDFWRDLPKDVKDNINQAEIELDQGQSKSHSEVMDDVRKRFLIVSQRTY